MYTTDKYISETIALTKSLKIKIEDTAIAINKALETTLAISTPVDKHEWKYYMNLAGIKHSTNTDISIHSIDTDTDIIINNNLKLNHPLTYSYIKDNSAVYNNLILKYPNNKDYLDGMLDPIDIDNAINAQDGIILYYDDRYVEEQEIDLIRVLEMNIKSYLARWHIKEYTLSDSLYLASMLATLYSFINNNILNIRMNNILTNKAHSYHIEQFFRSRFNIWEEVVYLNNDSKIWLYNNIDYLIKNAGKQGTLDSIVKNIFSRNDIGIGEVIIDVSDIERNIHNQDVITKPIDDKGVAKYVSKAYNKEYTNDSDTTRSLSSIITAEMLYDNTIDTYIIKDSTDYYTKIANSEINSGTTYKQRTKLLDINSYNIFKIDNDVTTQVVLDNFIYYGFNTTTIDTKSFKDPNTLLYYDLTPRQGAMLLLKYLMNMFDKDAKLRHYQYFSLLNDQLTFDELNTNTLSPNDNVYIFNTLLENIPVYPSNLSNINVFKKYINNCIDYYIVNNAMSSNLNNTTVITTLKAANDQILKRGSIDLRIDGVELTPTEMLLNEDIDITIYGDYDYKLSIVELLKLFTGINIDKYTELEKYINSFINIVNKLTSYTTQVTKNVEDIEPMTTPYTNVNINNTEVGIVTCLDAEIAYPLEPEFAWTKTVANDFNDNLKEFIIKDHINLNTCGYGISGYVVNGLSISELEACNTEPNVVAEILDTCPIYYTPTISTDGPNADNNIKYYNINNNAANVNKLGIYEVSYNEDANKDIVGNNTEPNAIVEILDTDPDYYTPTVSTDGPNADNNIKYYAIDNTKTNVDELGIREVSYTEDANKDITGGNTEPNVVTEILDTDPDYYKPTVSTDTSTTDSTVAVNIDNATAKVNDQTTREVNYTEDTNKDIVGSGTEPNVIIDVID